MQPARLDVVDRNGAGFGAALVAFLGKAGLVAELHRGPGPVLASLPASPPTLVVLSEDERHPEAMAALRQIRRISRVPCVVVGGEAAPDRTIGFLEAGADDLLPDGTPMPAMLARLRAVLRRAAWGLPAPEPEEAPATPCWRLIPARRELRRPDGGECRLTTAEYDLFALLAAQGPRPVGREAISRAVFRRAWRPEDRAVDGLVVRLRGKLVEAGAAREAIRTVHGRGYAFLDFAEAPLRRG